MGKRVEQVDARGFTLLELIITLFVLALAAGLTAPSIARSMDALRARTEIAGFSAVLRQAREQAITTRRARRVVVDTRAHQVQVLAGDEVQRTRPYPARWTIEALAEGTLALRFDPQGTSTGGDWRITADDARWRITIDPFTGRVRAARESRG